MAANHPFIHFISTNAVVRTESEACAAPLMSHSGSDLYFARKRFDDIGGDVLRIILHAGDES